MNLELVQFQNRLQREQHGHVIVNHQDSPLHKFTSGRSLQGTRVSANRCTRAPVLKIAAQDSRIPTGQKAPRVRYYRPVASFYIENFGCRATQADGAAIERQFRDRGLERAFLPSQAEIVVLNTCTVTASA